MALLSLRPTLRNTRLRSTSAPQHRHYCSKARAHLTSVHLSGPHDSERFVFCFLFRFSFSYFVSVGRPVHATQRPRPKRYYRPVRRHTRGHFVGLHANSNRYARRHDFRAKRREYFRPAHTIVHRRTGAVGQALRSCRPEQTTQEPGTRVEADRRRYGQLSPDDRERRVLENQENPQTVQEGEYQKEAAATPLPRRRGGRRNAAAVRVEILVVSGIRRVHVQRQT